MFYQFPVSYRTEARFSNGDPDCNVLYVVLQHVFRPPHFWVCRFAKSEHSATPKGAVLQDW